jgi:hypothetical protein
MFVLAGPTHAASMILLGRLLYCRVRHAVSAQTSLFHAAVLLPCKKKFLRDVAMQISPQLLAMEWTRSISASATGNSNYCKLYELRP